MNHLFRFSYISQVKFLVYSTILTTLFFGWLSYGLCKILNNYVTQEQNVMDSDLMIYLPSIMAVLVVSWILILHFTNLFFLSFQRVYGIDPCTQLFDGKYMANQILQEMDRSNRYDRAFSILLIEADQMPTSFFKSKFVLTSIAKLLSSSLRRTDVIGCHTHDRNRFIVLLHEQEESNALHVANKILDIFQATTFHYRKHPLPITISIAVNKYEKNLSYDLFMRQSENTLSKLQQKGTSMVGSFSNLNGTNKIVYLRQFHKNSLSSSTDSDMILM